MSLWLKEHIRIICHLNFAAFTPPGFVISQHHTRLKVSTRWHCVCVFAHLFCYHGCMLESGWISDSVTCGFCLYFHLRDCSCPEACPRVFYCVFTTVGGVLMHAACVHAPWSDVLACLCLTIRLLLKEAFDQDLSGLWRWTVGVSACGVWGLAYSLGGVLGEQVVYLG